MNHLQVAIATAVLSMATLFLAAAVVAIWIPVAATSFLFASFAAGALACIFALIATP